MLFTSSTAAVLGLALSVNGHVIMNTPRPYGFHTLQTSPLNGQNFKFPCQSGGRADAFDSTGVSNPMAAGTDQLLNFTGSAVHGGGSCQLSVTYDFPPPADKSKWRVIHTIIGGCPTSAVGNVPTQGADGDGRPDGPHCAPGKTGECVNTFGFQIPKGLKNGKATIAWTWFNKIGNREMYMNCAPIEISGGASDDSFYNGLPQIFVANLPGECTTKEGVLDIPNPGTSVVRNGAASPDALGTCSAAAGSSPGSSSGSSSGGSAPSSGGSSSSPSTPATPAQKSPPANVGGVFAPAAPVAPAASASSTGASQPIATPAPATNGSSSGASTGSCPTGKVSCPTPGALVCVGTNQFGICGIDNCALAQNLAAGDNRCASGVSAAKRDLHALSHGKAHRRRGAGLRRGA